MIEDIILNSDKKGISRLRKYLSRNYCEKSARYILENMKRVFIITGFYIRGTGSCETDGISGSLNLAKILRKLGSKVVLLSDQYCSPILEKISDFKVINFSQYSKNTTVREASLELIGEFNPTLVINVERCGRSEDGKYYNIKGEDITPHTINLDIFARKIKHSVGIGDLGNEIGMGNLYDKIKEEGIINKPSVTEVDHLTIASVSDWGCYGIIAYLSKISERNFLKDIEIEKLAFQMSRLGVVDGVTKKNELTVDGYSLDKTKKIIRELKKEIKNN